MKLLYKSRHPKPGILTYELVGPPGRPAIILEFRDSPFRYVYDTEKPGPAHVEAMTRLAQQGTGLTTYVNQHVREGYARKVPR